MQDGKKKRTSVNSQQHLTFDTPLAMCSPPKSATDGNTGLQRELLPLATAVDPWWRGGVYGDELNVVVWKLVACGSWLLSSADCGVLRLDELHAAAACHRRTRPTPSLQQYYHAGRSAVSAVSLLGRCVYRRKVCLTSESCGRSSTAARSRLSVALDVVCGDDTLLLSYNTSSLQNSAVGPELTGFMVCGGEHSSESCLLSSVRWRSSWLLNSAVAQPQQHSVSSTHTCHTPLTPQFASTSESCEVCISPAQVCVAGACVWTRSCALHRVRARWRKKKQKKKKTVHSFS